MTRISMDWRKGKRRSPSAMTTGTATATATTTQQQQQLQKQNAGSLHCAAHDGTVSSFGRDDADFDGLEKRQTQIPFCDDNWNGNGNDNATATAIAKAKCGDLSTALLTMKL
jgi:hypothetical protein